MIGIDVVSITRIERFIARHDKRGLARFLNDSEIALAKRPASAAGLWAAKEACAKALGTGIGSEVGFRDITISKNEKGAPLLTLSAKVQERFRITQCALSITHDAGLAIAVVMLKRD
ncbi:MAG: holo-ACP synthase [Wolinella sp.]